MRVLYRGQAGTFQPRGSDGRYAERFGTRTVTVHTPAGVQTRTEPSHGPRVLTQAPNSGQERR